MSVIHEGSLPNAAEYLLARAWNHRAVHRAFGAFALCLNYAQMTNNGPLGTTQDSISDNRGVEVKSDLND